MKTTLSEFAGSSMATFGFSEIQKSPDDVTKDFLALKKIHFNLHIITSHSNLFFLYYYHNICICTHKYVNITIRVHFVVYAYVNGSGVTTLHWIISQGALLFSPSSH